MKKLMMAAVLAFGLPAFAGKMKEIHLMVNESVLDTLGFDEDVVKIEGFNFVKVAGADLAVHTVVRMYYSPSAPAPTFDCVTTFKQVADQSFEVIKTKCVEKKD